MDELNDNKAIARDAKELIVRACVQIVKPMPATYVLVTIFLIGGSWASAVSKTDWFFTSPYAPITSLGLMLILVSIAQFQEVMRRRDHEKKLYDLTKSVEGMIEASMGSMRSTHEQVSQLVTLEQRRKLEMNTFSHFREQFIQVQERIQRSAAEAHIAEDLNRNLHHMKLPMEDVTRDIVRRSDGAFHVRTLLPDANELAAARSALDLAAIEYRTAWKNYAVAHEAEMTWIGEQCRRLYRNLFQLQNAG